MRPIFLIMFSIVFVSCKNEINSSPTASANPTVAQSSDISEVPTQDLEVYDYEGLKQYLTTASDKTYIVNFWATWCAPCIKELPYFEKINADYSDDNVEVILVSLDFPKKYESQLKPYIKEKQIKSKVIALNDPDSNSWIPQIDESWSGAIPATLIFNKSKRQFYEQSFTYDELEKEVKQFLK